MKMILDGIRVIDWTQWHAGPHAATMLADLGAEVIHIERLVQGDGFRGAKAIFGVPVELGFGRNLAFEDLNRGKKGMALDVSKAEGQEIIYQLVKKSDVFMTNFRGAQRVGVDYETLRQHNPRLIYASISGFGTKGPDKDAPVLELAGYARSGIMLGSGEEGMSPVYITCGTGDRITGIFLAYGIIAALLGRERLGIVQEVSTSLLGALVTIQGIGVLPTLLVGKEYERPPRARANNPLFNTYLCKDGRWVALSSTQDVYWPIVCKAIGMAELEKDPRFSNLAKRQENKEELISLLDRVFATKSSKEWAEVMRQTDLIFSVVNSMMDLGSDPQVLENHYILDWNHPVLGPVKWVGFPVEFSETPVTLRGPAPELGQHTEEILSEVLGYTWDNISKLREKGVI